MTDVKRIKIDDIKIDFSIIGRENLNEEAVERYKDLINDGWEKAILLQKDTLRLIDGAHRLEATRRLSKGKILTKLADIKDGDLRAEAYRANREHGVPYSKEERNNIVVKLYTEDGKTQNEIGKLFRQSQGWISQIIKSEENINILVTNNTNIDHRREITPDGEIAIALLAIKGEKQEDLAEKFDINQSRVSQIKTDYVSKLRERYLEGEGRTKISDDTGIDLKLLDTLLVTVNDKDPLDFSLPMTTWWDGISLTDERQRKNRFPGNIPVQLVKNIFGLFTKPEYHILDPFAGGGVTKLACDDMIGRTYELFDIEPAISEIKYHSVREDNGGVILPPVKTNPDFIFLDPPYSSQKKGDYSPDNRDLSNITHKEFIDFFDSFFKEVRKEWEPKLAMLMSSQKDSGYIHDLPTECAYLLQKNEYKMIDHIVVHVNHPESRDIWVKRAKEGRWLLREHIHILVAEGQ